MKNQKRHEWIYAPLVWLFLGIQCLVFRWHLEDKGEKKLTKQEALEWWERCRPYPTKTDVLKGIWVAIKIAWLVGFVLFALVMFEEVLDTVAGLKDSLTPSGWSVAKWMPLWYFLSVIGVTAYGLLKISGMEGWRRSLRKRKTKK